jgi:predicted lipoprotein with Yx(FWY)xxD motif
VRYHRAFATIPLTFATLAVAGCGGGNSSGGGNYPTSSSAASAARTATSGAGYSTTTGAAAPAAAGGGGGQASSAGAATAITTVHTGLGTILAAGPKRLTVYLFAADTPTRSACSSACAQVWPPVTTTGAPRAVGGARSADLATIARAGGTRQVTYRGHPLYYYVGDSASGLTTGQGLNSFGAAWSVLSVQGSGVGGS